MQIKEEEVFLQQQRNPLKQMEENLAKMKKTGSLQPKTIKSKSCSGSASIQIAC